MKMLLSLLLLLSIWPPLVSEAVGEDGQIALADLRHLLEADACATVTCLQGKADQFSHTPLPIRALFYVKWLALDNENSQATRGILSNIPVTEAQQIRLMTIADAREGITGNDMKQMARLYRDWPKALSLAVRRMPEFLPAYIKYGRLAIEDPHLDFTLPEEGVCRSDPAKFKAAFGGLNRNDQEYIRSTVFDPDRCKAVFVSEGGG